MAPKESACSAGDTGNMGLIPRSERSSGEGNGNPLHCSCLKKPTDRGAYSTQSCKEFYTTEQISISSVQSLSHVRLLRPHGCSPLCPSVRGILQARVLEWVAISFSRGSS